MTIGIVTAMPEERRALVKALLGATRSRHGGMDIYSGTLEGSEVWVVEGGMGATAADAAARMLLAIAKPGLLVSAGYCGAVRPGPKVGDIVVCHYLLEIKDGLISGLQLPEPALSLQILADRLRESGLVVWDGSFITANGIITKSGVSDILPADFPNPVLEMESAVVARVAAGAGVPFIGLRAVSDDASEELGFSLEEITGDDRKVSIWRVIGLLAARPALLPQFVRLGIGSARAGRSLGRALGLAVAISCQDTA